MLFLGVVAIFIGTKPQAPKWTSEKMVQWFKISCSQVEYCAHLANSTGYSVNFSITLDSQTIYKCLNFAEYKMLSKTAEISVERISLKPPITISNHSKYVSHVCDDSFVPSSISFAMLPEHQILFLPPYKPGFYHSVISNPSILGISEVPVIKTLNRWNTGFIESGNYTPIIIDNYLTSQHPMHEQGITGENQVVTLIDTGIDTSSLFFADPTREVPFNSTDLLHRKIIRYEALGNKIDRPNGHGTHIAGILAGNASCGKCPASLYNGIAPSSKLFFIDVGVSEIEDESSAQYDPFTVVEEMKLLNSHIFSNSWGFPPSFSEWRAEFDTLAFRNQDILFVFACGNSGRAHSIFQPSGGKNVLAVGGTSPPPIGRIEHPLTRSSWLVVGEKKIPIYPVLSAPDYFSLHRLSPLNSSTNLDFVSQNYESNNSLVYIFGYDSNLCDTIEKIESKRPIAVVIFRNESFRCEDVEVPLFISDSSSLDFVKQFKKASLEFTVEQNSAYLIKKASFSSSGPSDLGLLKPEVVAPAQFVISAQSRGRNSILLSRSGTSMAAPLIAGASALIRQYLEDGWYPEFTPKKANSILPSSCLLKAMILHCSRQINDSTQTPNMDYGFGVPNLSKILLFNSSESIILLNSLIIKPRDHLSGTFQLNDNKSELVISMVYIDTSLGEDSEIPLATDVDLIVVSPSGRLFFGNNISGNIEETHSTSERVFIPQEILEIGNYSVHIISGSIPGAKDVNFSLVISGYLSRDGFAITPNYSCLSNCLDRGKCINGFCQCNENSTGSYCQSSAEEILLNEVVLTNVSARHWKRFFISIRSLPRMSRLKFKFGTLDILVVTPQIEISLGAPMKFGGKMVDFIAQGMENQVYVSEKIAKLAEASNYVYISFYPLGIGDLSLNFSISLINEPEMSWQLELITGIIALFALSLFGTLIYRLARDRKLSSGEADMDPLLSDEEI